MQKSKRWKDNPYSCTGKISIVNISTFLNPVYRSNTIHIKFLVTVFQGLEKSILKFMEAKRLGVAKSNLMIKT